MNPSSTTARVIRSLRRSPGFVAIATLSMGVALGISTSVFAVMDAMTHPDPPFRDVGQLHDIRYISGLSVPPPPGELTGQVLSIDGVERIAEWQLTFDYTVMVGEFVGGTAVGKVRSGFFDVLGTRARIGRLFTASDYTAGDVAVVTDKVWRRDFANRPSIGNATVQADGRVFRVVGILPTGADRSLRADVYLPETGRALSFPSFIIRLKPGVTMSEFQPRLKAVNDQMTKVHAGPKDRGVRAFISSLRPDPLQVRDFHRAMVGASVCILLIACANIAALMLARGMVRRRDYALRLALGARPMEIGREVVVEVATLAVAGCVAGALVTSWFVGLIGRAMPPEMEWFGFVQPQWSWRVLALAMSAVVLSVAVAGGFPAWMAARTDPAGPLKEGSGGTTGRAGTRFRWLVMAELAIAMTLLMSTSLMLKSIRMMERYEFGYPTERLALVGVGAPWQQDSTTVAESLRLREQALAVIRAVPGVEAAIPYLRQGCGHPIVMGDRSAEGGASVNLLSNNYRGGGGCTAVGPRFFSTLGLRVVEGRDFEDGDAAPDTPGAVILDEKTARILFPHESAVGRLVRFGNASSTQPWVQVVGVVQNHMLGFDPHPELGPDSASTVYLAVGPRVRTNRQGQSRGSRSMAFIVRTASNSDSTRLAVKRALAPLTPSGGRASVTPWNQDFESQLRTEEFLSLVFTCLGLASLLLGAAGLFSVISYIAGQRTREYAVRIALGATKENVITLVMREAFTMAIGGTAVGAGFGMWAAFLLWDRMWGVYPVDAQALVLAEVTLVIVTMLACLGPALRASRSNPLDVIRAA